MEQSKYFLALLYNMAKGGGGRSGNGGIGGTGVFGLFGSTVTCKSEDNSFYCLFVKFFNLLFKSSNLLFISINLGKFNHLFMFKYSYISQLVITINGIAVNDILKPI